MTLTVTQITHRYPTTSAERPPVLQDVSFQLEAGEQLLLRGISGSGKTTLINILAGLLTPTTGTVMMGDQIVYQLGEAERDLFRRSQIGYVFQTHHLLPILNAWENVAMPLAFAGVSVNERKARAFEWLDQVGLKQYANSRPGQLSNGQRQRVAIARAMVNQPQLILADEPTGNLDSVMGNEIMDILLNLNQEDNATVVMVTHDENMAKRTNRLVRLFDGTQVL